MSQLAKDIAEYLKEYHCTEVEAVKSRDLCLIFNLTDNRHVRSIVTHLRQEGEPICSSSNGYWSRRSNQSILKETSPGCSLEGLMLRLKLQYFSHLM